VVLPFVWKEYLYDPLCEKNTYMTLCTFIQATSLKMTRHQKRKIDETHVEVFEYLFFVIGSQDFSSLFVGISNKCAHD
jgi:hypothetical protein